MNICNSDALITIIIPVYNVEQYLLKCIESVKCQTYKHLEIIVVDDGSSDGSSEICDSFLNEPGFVVLHQDNKGQGAARNRALDIMRGDYVCFLDSDDSIKPDYIEFLYGLITDHSLDISACNFEMYNEDGRFIKKRKNGSGYLELTGIEAIKSMWTQGVINIAPWGKLYKSSLWKNVRFKECFSEDWATMHFVYEQANRIGYNYVCKLNYLVRGNSSIRAFQDRKLIMIDIANDNIEYSKAYPELINPAIQKAVSVYFHLLFQLPNSSKYYSTKKLLIEKINSYRNVVLNDPDCLRKTKIALVLSRLFGFRFTNLIFKIAKKNNAIF